MTVAPPPDEIPLVPEPQDPEASPSSPAVVFMTDRPLASEEVEVAVEALPVKPQRLASLDVFRGFLSDGQSARISRALIYTQRLCLSAFGSGNITEHPNLFFAVCIVQPGRTPAEAEKALIAQFESLKTEGVTSHELQRAQNQFARDYILGRESDEDKALHLAHAAVIHNDITTADGEFDIFMKTSVADVQRVARSYFNQSNRVVLHVLPKGGAR